jgi:hypothetical protein
VWTVLRVARCARIAAVFSAIVSLSENTFKLVITGNAEALPVPVPVRKIRICEDDGTHLAPFLTNTEPQAMIID